MTQATLFYYRVVFPRTRVHPSARSVRGLDANVMISAGAATPSAPSSNTRELLLSKLARERLLHSHTAAATTDDRARRASDRIPLDRHSSDSIATQGEGGDTGSEVYDSAGRTAERQAKLRSQAQLRVRLAAAKQVAARNTGGSSTQEGVSAVHGVTIGMEGNVQSQEEALKNMLAERRRSAVAHK